MLVLADVGPLVEARPALDALSELVEVSVVHRDDLNPVLRRFEVLHVGQGGDLSHAIELLDLLGDVAEERQVFMAEHRRRALDADDQGIEGAEDILDLLVGLGHRVIEGDESVG